MEKNLDILVSELKELDNELVQIDGTLLKPSQCYRFETDPVHLLFNTNCPDSLKQKVQAILDKHLPAHESGSSQ
jgi:hypothetical protein